MAASGYTQKSKQRKQAQLNKALIPPGPSLVYWRVVKHICLYIFVCLDADSIWIGRSLKLSGHERRSSRMTDPMQYLPVCWQTCPEVSLVVCSKLTMSCLCGDTCTIMSCTGTTLSF